MSTTHCDDAGVVAEVDERQMFAVLTAARRPSRTTVTVWPICSGRSSPHWWVRIEVGGALGSVVVLVVIVDRFLLVVRSR